MTKKLTSMENTFHLFSLGLQSSAVLGYKFYCTWLQFGENSLIYQIKDRYLILIFLQWELLNGFHWQQLLNKTSHKEAQLRETRRNRRNFLPSLDSQYKSFREDLWSDTMQKKLNLHATFIKQAVLLFTHPPHCSICFLSHVKHFFLIFRL